MLTSLCLGLSGRRWGHCRSCCYWRLSGQGKKDRRVSKLSSLHEPPEQPDSKQSQGLIFLTLSHLRVISAWWKAFWKRKWPGYRHCLVPYLQERLMTTVPCDWQHNLQRLVVCLQSLATFFWVELDLLGTVDSCWPATSPRMKSISQSARLELDSLTKIWPSKLFTCVKCYLQKNWPHFKNFFVY